MQIFFKKFAKIKISLKKKPKSLSKFLYIILIYKIRLLIFLKFPTFNFQLKNKFPNKWIHYRIPFWCTVFMVNWNHPPQISCFIMGGVATYSSTGQSSLRSMSQIMTEGLMRRSWKIKWRSSVHYLRQHLFSSLTGKQICHRRRRWWHSIFE